MGDNAGTKAKIQECMNEARLQRDFVHKNVVAMYGVAVMENPIAIILELAAGWILSLIKGCSKFDFSVPVIRKSKLWTIS